MSVSVPLVITKPTHVPGSALITLVRGAECLEVESEVCRAWDFLWRACDHASYACHRGFVQAYYRTWGESSLPVVGVLRVGGEVVALLPATESPALPAALTSSAPFADYWEPLVLAGSEARFSEALLELLASDYRQGFSIGSVDEAAPWLKALRQCARRRGWEIESSCRKVCPVVRLGMTAGGEDWKSYLGRRRRLRRELRVLMSTESLRSQWWPSECCCDEPLAFFFAHHLERFPASPYRCATRRDFLRRVVTRLTRSDNLRLRVLHHAGAMIGVAIWFKRENRLWFLNGAWEPRSSGLGPGKLLHASVIADSGCSDAAVLDFMTGREPYKLEYANGRIDTVRLHIQPRF